MGLNKAYRLRFDDSFILVGGFGGSPWTSVRTPRDGLLKYHPQTDTWAEIPGKMRLPRDDVVAIVVDLEIFPQCH